MADAETQTSSADEILEVDERRVAWAMGDLIENRPALSRWHPEWRARFEAFLAKARG